MDVPRGLLVAPQLTGSGAPRCIAEAGERLCRAARRDADHVATWGRMTFYRCNALRTTVRAGDDGIAGGWIYATVGMQNIDWSEIESVALKLDGEIVDLRKGDHA